MTAFRSTAAALPSPLMSAARILLLRRPGLQDPAAMPVIERRIEGLQLDPDWLRRYRDCVGLDGDAAERHGVPPLALQIAAAPWHLSVLADPAFPFPALGLVHLSQEIVQHRAVLPTARLDLRVCTTEARSEARGTSFGLVTEAREGGALVWRSSLRALSMTRTRTTGQRTPGRPDEAPVDEPVLTEERLLVPESMGRRYARIAGDRNPIHQHAVLARPFGFRRAIVHGTWTLARALVSAGQPSSPAFELHASFRRPVELPSEIVVRSSRGARDGEVRVRVSDPRSGKTHLAIEVAARGA